MKKYFEFEKLGTNYRREIIGGLTTFLAMAYILAVNPLMLSLDAVPDLPDAMRMDKGAVFVATALAAAVGSLFMGLIARYPIGLAPGMGLNAFFAFTVVLDLRNSVANSIDRRIILRNHIYFLIVVRIT